MSDTWLTDYADEIRVRDILAATPLNEAFTAGEWMDIYTAAKERGVSIYELVHDAVVNDLYR